MTEQLSLEPPLDHEQSIQHLIYYALTWTARMLSGSLQGYRVEVTSTEDLYMRRTNLMTRIFIDAPGSTRARHAMSFNWYHKDKLHDVERRLSKRLTAFAERIKPKLKSPKQMRHLIYERTKRAQRKAEAEARMVPESDQRMAEALANLDEVFRDPSPA